MGFKIMYGVLFLFFPLFFLFSNNRIIPSKLLLFMLKKHFSFQIIFCISMLKGKVSFLI